MSDLVEIPNCWFCHAQAQIEANVGIDQEMAQPERIPLQKPRWEKTKLIITDLYQENIS